ncbi:MAG: hypothetical protein Q8P88_00920 [Candidatus Jorgensenbacteria bacterium]|nr:hypothetical protein [Candidatus Jorgensenbacteria bacterium]
MMDWHAVLNILHLLGVAVGAGGAFVSDAMFFSSVRDEKISTTEMRFLTMGSAAVWVGLALLFLSGLGLVWMDPAHTLGSEKFWAKMTVVVIIFANGLFFRRFHIPRLARHVGEHFPSSDEFIRRVPLLLASGAVSAVSWVSAIVLGALRGVPYGYGTIMGAYLAFVFLGVVLVLVFRKRFIAHLR